MADFGFNIVPKNFFLDRKAIVDKVGRANARALALAGGYVRKVAQRSMRPANKKHGTAPPGTPPRYHAKNLRDLIFFGLVGDTGVRIGPVKYRKGEAPALLEFGGTATRTDKRGRPYTAHYRGNPFMQPALTKAVAEGKIAAAWQGILRR